MGYRQSIEALHLEPKQKQQLEAILRLRGGKEICTHASELSSSAEAAESIAHLCAVFEVLEAYGVSEHVLIDLTMIGDFSYYTGMTFEGYAAELGSPVCSGGRYDNLLQQFGRALPATGFALKQTGLSMVFTVSQLKKRNPYVLNIALIAGPRL